MQVFICPTDETFLDRAYGRAFTQTLAFVNITYLALCEYSTPCSAAAWVRARWEWGDAASVTSCTQSKHGTVISAREVLE